MAHTTSRVRDKLAAEEAALRRSNIHEFQFLSIAGLGCNGLVFYVQHMQLANPFSLTKTYVLKAMLNMHSLESRELHSSYKKEFDTFIALAPARRALQAVGKRDGLVAFFRSFTAAAPPDMLKLVTDLYGRQFTRDNFPPDPCTCCLVKYLCPCLFRVFACSLVHVLNKEVPRMLACPLICAHCAHYIKYV